MAGNTNGNAMTNAWATTASKFNAFMPTANQVATTGGRKRRSKKSRKGSKKGSRKVGKKSRRRRKQKVLGFDIF
jgi:hypothetical protein